MQTTERRLRSSRQVRERYGGISDMTLWRWLHAANIGFPQPEYINRRRYWREDQLDAWDAARGEQSTSAAAA